MMLVWSSSDLLVHHRNTEVDDRNRNMANDEENQIEDAANEEDQIQDVADEEDQIKDAADDDKDQDADIFDADTDVENESKFFQFIFFFKIF